VPCFLHCPRRSLLLPGILLRVSIIAATSKEWFDTRFMPRFGPVALLGLLYTIIVMFASQDIIGQIGGVARVAVPMVLYFLSMFGTSLAVSFYCHMSYGAAATQAFTAASNNFELAIAIAVATFGVQSQEALAATVGPLIEVPVLLALVHVSLAAKRRLWDRAAAP
jgi:ACR3 family arsenite transporter